MSSYALYTLRDLRVAGERQAEQALAEAVAAVRHAEVERDRLTARLDAARAARRAAVAAEAPVVGPTASALTASQAQTVRRFWARLDEETRAAAAAIDRHRAAVLAPAMDSEEATRAAHLRARQRREVVDRAIARREALRRQEEQRREEAAADDLGRRRKT